MILAVNTGSSSVRLALFEERTARKRERLERNRDAPTPADELRRFAGAPPDRVVHRVVHGGELTAPTEVTPAVESRLEALVPLAPLHQPMALAWLRAAREAFPGAQQLAVFDTAFFSSLPEVARSYALPPRLGVRRYGFHGLAHRAMWRNLARAHGRAITLQLGSGCSAAAILDGRPLDTSMGQTPLEGLVMATRPGDLDPGVARGLDEHLLNHESGLLGLSGESGDIRELLTSPTENARRAIDLYVYRIKKYIGAYMAVLGGIDVLVFSGGVGEHQPTIRAAALTGMEPFGLVLDEARNQAVLGTKNSMGSRIDAGGAVEVWVLPSDEEQQMVDEILE
jgi:acetate kinase